jgi:transposase
VARPLFSPTDEQRRTVKTLSGIGVQQEQIATILDVAPHTLRKHFRKELDRGLAEASAQVLGNLYKKAIGNDTKATIYWIERQARWGRGRTVSESSTVPPQFVLQIEDKSQS